MAKNLSRRQEQQGTRWVFFWGIVAAVVIAFGFTVGPWLNSLGTTHPYSEAIGQVASQENNINIASKTTSPPHAAK